MSTGSSIGFARAAVARSLVSFLARYPTVSVERLLRHAGITPQLLDDPNGLLSFKLWVELGEMAAADADDSAIGAQFAAQIPWRDLGALAYVIFNSPTLGTALGNACRYWGLQQNVARSSLEIRDSEAHLVYGIDHPEIPDHAQNSEATLMVVLRVCRDGLQDPAWTPREVRFKHQRPASIETQTRMFRCPIHYDQPVDALVLACADLREPMRGADPDLLPILLQHADAVLAKTTFDDDFAGLVTRAVISSLSSGEATIEHIGMQLGSSPRTIQRRLREQGLSFNEVIARARLALAQRYLRDPSITITDTAFLLGFSDLSSFSRAFRRWTGRSAIEFRREQLSES